MEEDTKFYGNEIKIYKYTVFSPGQAMSWYSAALPDFENAVCFSPQSHGVITEAHIPRGCKTEDLILFLNGVHVPNFFIRNVARLVDGKRWEQTPEWVSPSPRDLANAILTENWD